jgi:hypothetical protein
MKSSIADVSHLPDLTFDPTTCQESMAPYRLRGLLTLFSLSTLFVTTTGSQFPLRPPAGYGAPYASSEKSFGALHSETAYAPYDSQEELYTWEPPTDAEIPELSALSDEHFTRVGLALFPDHSIRIKKSADWCDSSVRHVPCPLFPNF